MNKQMLSVPVPRDISKYEAKVVAGLTKRQLVCILGIAGIDIILYGILKPIVADADIRNLIMILASMGVALFMIPFGGVPFEKAFPLMFLVYFVYPKTRAREWELAERETQPEVKKTTKKKAKKKLDLKKHPEYKAF